MRLPPLQSGDDRGANETRGHAAVHDHGIVAALQLEPLDQVIEIAHPAALVDLGGVCRVLRAIRADAIGRQDPDQAMGAVDRVSHDGLDDRRAGPRKEARGGSIDTRTQAGPVFSCHRWTMLRSKIPPCPSTAAA